MLQTLFATVISPVAVVMLSTAFPSGGQLRARRNAWAGMSDDAARSRVRREAEAELQRAADRAGAGRDTAVR